jgi:hypothetical protein
MRSVAGSLLLFAALATVLRASPTPEPQVEMVFVKTHLAQVLALYETLVGKPVRVSEDLRDRPVSINSKGEIPRSAAIKMIESRLGNYDIRIVERDGALFAIVPEEGGAVDPETYYAETAGLSGEALKEPRPPARPSRSTRGRSSQRRRRPTSLDHGARTWRGSPSFRSIPTPWPTTVCRSASPSILRDAPGGTAKTCTDFSGPTTSNPDIPAPRTFRLAKALCSRGFR